MAEEKPKSPLEYYADLFANGVEAKEWKYEARTGQMKANAVDGLKRLVGEVAPDIQKNLDIGLSHATDAWKNGAKAKKMKWATKMAHFLATLESRKSMGLMPRKKKTHPASIDEMARNYDAHATGDRYYAGLELAMKQFGITVNPKIKELYDTGVRNKGRDMADNWKAKMTTGKKPKKYGKE